MKNLISHLFFFVTVCMFLSCSKPANEPVTCEDTNIAKVTFANTSDIPLRVVVSTRLTPEYVPIEPIFTIDLAPGKSIVKEFEAGRYINTWYKDCSSNCNRMNSFFRNYEQCKEYQEKQ